MAKKEKTAAELIQKYSREHYGDKKNPEKAKRRNINKPRKKAAELRARNETAGDKIGRKYADRFANRAEGRPKVLDWRRKQEKLQSKLSEQKVKTEGTKRVKSKIPGSPPAGWNKFKTRGSANLRGIKAGGLAALAAAIAEPAVRAGYGAVKKRVKRNQETAHKRKVESQDKRMMKKYKKSDPKKQAIFKKLMSKKTKITQQR